MYLNRKMFDPDAEGGQAQPEERRNQDPEWSPAGAMGHEDDTPSSPIRDALIAQGYQVPDDYDDQQLLDHIAEGYSRAQQAPPEDVLKQYQEILPVVNDYTKHADEFREYLKSKNAQAERQEEEAPGWTPLEEDPEWDLVTEWDPETNRFIPKGKYGSAAAAEARNRYHREQTDRARRMMNDPLGVVRQAGLDKYLEQVKEEMRKEILGQIQSEQQQLSSQARIRSELQQYQNHFVRMDEEGQPLVDPSTGRVVLTEVGQRYSQAAQIAREHFGISDDLKVHEFAMHQLGRLESDEEQTQQAARERNAKQKSRVMDAAKGKGGKARSTNRGATIAASAARQDAQTDGLSWEELIKQTEEEISG